MTRALLVLFALAAPAAAAEPFRAVADEVNQKLVKLFGSGGFRGVANYGTGILVSPDGHILTAASTLLDTSELIVHLADGRRMRAVVVVTEPALDAALVRIKVEGKKPDEPTDLDLPFFDVAAAAARPPAAPGDWVLAVSNQFEFAQRDEPMSVQRGVVAAVSKLSGRRGIFDFPYAGEVYVIDQVTNNPGAAGGALTDRKGNLLGVLGRDIKNVLTETLVNYAIPIGAKVDVQDGDKKVTLSPADFVARAVKGEYKPVKRDPVAAGPGGYHGIVFVPNVVGRTPPYVEAVRPGSPAATAGLRPDDLVSFVDGEPVYSIKGFLDVMARTRPGTTVRLEVRRGDKLQTVEVTLAAQPKPAAPPR